MASLTVPPGLPTFLEGFLNLENSALPVLRLSRLLDLPEQSPGLFAQLIILKTGKARLALMVDKVEEIVTIATDDFVSFKEKLTFNDCVVSQVPFRDTQAHVLSPENILLQEEQKIIHEFQVLAEQRLQKIRKQDLVEE